MAKSAPLPLPVPYYSLLFRRRFSVQQYRNLQNVGSLSLFLFAIVWCELQIDDSSQLLSNGESDVT